METEKILNNAHKITYLVHAYPGKKFQDTRDEKTGKVLEQGLVSMMAMPAIDINAAMWAAQDWGWLGVPDPKTDMVPIVDLPTKWKFGQAQEDFQAAILYALGKLAKKETDLEEFTFNGWLAGYPPHDIFVAVKYLQETKKLAEYLIEDGEAKYLFYTLYENREQLWGRKQFKKDPLKQTKQK